MPIGVARPGFGAPVLADCAGAACVVSHVNKIKRAALVYPRAAGLFSFEAEPRLDAPVKVPPARLATIIDFATLTLDDNPQAKIMRELNQSALSATRGAFSVSGGGAAALAERRWGGAAASEQLTPAVHWRTPLHIFQHQLRCLLRRPSYSPMPVRRAH